MHVFGFAFKYGLSHKATEPLVFSGNILYLYPIQLASFKQSPTVFFRKSCCNFFVTEAHCQSTQYSPCQLTVLNRAIQFSEQFLDFKDTIGQQKECQIDLSLHECERSCKKTLSASVGIILGCSKLINTPIQPNMNRIISLHYVYIF